jgi:hypothetical protein
MSTPVLVDHGAGNSATRRRLLLASAAVVWLVLYQVNPPWWDWIVYDLAGLDETTRVGGAVHFFLYDTTKIALLLTGVIFVVTMLRRFTAPPQHPRAGCEISERAVATSESVVSFANRTKSWFP